MDIHAQSIEIIQEGYMVSHPVPVWKLIAGTALFIGAAIYMSMVLKRKRMVI
jgi:hypothetical protein